MPGGQEPAEHGGRHRLRLLAQPGQAAAPQHAQHPAVAPLGAARPARNSPSATRPSAASRRSAIPTTATPSPYRSARTADRERPVRPRPPRHQVTQRVGQHLGERLGDADRQRHPEGVPQPPGVLDRRPHRLPGHPHLDDAPGGGEPGQPAGRGAGVNAPRGDLVRGQRPRRAQQVGDGLRVLAPPRRDRCCRSASVSATTAGSSSSRSALGAEQLREQRRVEREGLRAPLGERRVPLVHERADVPEEQVPPERARRDRLHLDEADPPRGEVAEHLGQRGHVEHVLQALPDGLERDREPGELRGDLKQLRATAAAAATAASAAPAAAGGAAAPARRTRGTGRRTARTRRPRR